MDESNNDKQNIVLNIKKYQDANKEMLKKEKTLTAIKAKCDVLGEHHDVKILVSPLSEQLARTIEMIRIHLKKMNEKVLDLETQLTIMNQKFIPVTPSMSEDTLDSSDVMPENIQQIGEGRYEVETQTSECSQVFPKNTERVTVESSVQTTLDAKPTENILVTQTQSEGHETIKIESAPNPHTNADITEDVFVDAKYKHPNDATNKSTELILRNVPQTTFETVFVEPDNTTTEVFIDNDGRKQIIVRKVTRTIIQQQQLVQKKERTTKISSMLVPEPKEVSQPKGESSNQVVESVIENPIITEESPVQSIQIDQQSPQNEEILVENPVFDQSSVQTVMHHVTQHVIRRKRKIIRRVTVINGKEHITEEVIEEPEEIEVIENQTPSVNINVTTTTPIVEFPPDEETTSRQLQECISEPVILSENKESVTIQNKDKNIGASEKVKQEENSQVFSDFEQAARVDLVDNAQVVADLPTTIIGDVNLVQLPAKIIKIETEPTKLIHEASHSQENIVPTHSIIVDISDIWPTTKVPEMSLPIQRASPRNQELCSYTIDIQPSEFDSIPSGNIWPLDNKTGNIIPLNEYIFEQVPKIQLDTENVISASDYHSVSEINVEPDIRLSLAEETDSQIEVLPPIKSSQVDSPIGELNKDNAEFSKTEETANKSKSESEDETNLNSAKAVESASQIDEKFNISPEQENQSVEPSESEKSSQKTYSIEKNQRRKKKSKKNKNDKQTEQTESETQDPRASNENTVKNVQNPISKKVVQDPVILIQKCDDEPQEIEPNKEDQITELKVKSIDVRSATQLFIDNELNVSDGTTRTVKLTMSPKEPSSPTSVTVKLKLDSSEQPNLNVNLIEEHLILSEPKEQSEAESIDAHVTDNTISDEMEMPEIVASPIPQIDESDVKSIMYTEKLVELSPDESYKSISELEEPIKIVEEGVLSSSSDSPIPLVSQVIIAAQVIEEQNTENAEQQTDLIDQVHIDRVNVTKSVQTSPEKAKILIDEELQTTLTNPESLVDIEVQTIPIVEDNVEKHLEIEPKETVHEEVCYHFIQCIMKKL